MEILNQKTVEAYLGQDLLLQKLNLLSSPVHEELTCQQWLRDSSAKRYTYQYLYGDLISSTNKKILDVGGGLTAFSSFFSEKHDYSLIELMTHDNELAVETFMANTPELNLFNGDWYSYQSKEKFDVIIANDLFPNVDQRLEIFLEKFLPLCKEIRLSLTFYDNDRFYITKRVDADEILCVKPWDGQQLEFTLKKYESRLINADMDLFSQKEISLFPNGRQVILACLKGNLD